jgi:hypothetical protein
MDLLTDWHKLRGRTVGAKTQQLEQALSQSSSYTFEAVMAVFGLAMPSKAK